jgi:hypothetical protein
MPELGDATSEAVPEKLNTAAAIRRVTTNPTVVKT